MVDERTATASTQVERPAAFPLEASRLRLPFLRPGIVRRSSVLHRLDAEEPSSVLLVVAGAGYGKTTMLHQWAADQSRAIAWLGLAPDDNDPTVLLTYLATALAPVVALDPDVFAELATEYPSTTRVAQLVANGLAKTTEPVVLVLDDLHALANPVCLDVIDRLLRHASPTARMALASRRMPGGSIPRLRAQGSVVEVGPDDLAMGPAEATELWAGSGVELSAADADPLVEATEGWPVALYLAARSARARDATGQVLAPGVPGRSVVEYVHAELLSSLGAGTVQFLTRSAVLDRMSGSSCDAVLLTFGSGERLEEYARVNLLVVPLDEDGTWYRYHHLFRELLLAELERREPELVRRLQARAARWHQAHGSLDDAVEYAMAAEDVGRAASIVANHVPALYREGRSGTLERWFEWFEARDAMASNAAVAVAGAWWAALQGQAGMADRWATAAARAHPRDSVSADNARPIEGPIALVQAVLCRHGIARALDDIAHAERLFPMDHTWRHALLLMGGVTRLASGASADADRVLVEAAEVAQGARAGPALSSALAERALLALARGDPDDARRLADMAVDVVERGRLRDHAGSALVFAVAARLASRDGDRERARSLLAGFQRARGRLTHAMPLLAVQARVEAIRALLALADGAGARTLLREVDEILRLRPGLGVLETQVEDVRAQVDAIPGGGFGASTLTGAELRVLPLLQTHHTFRGIGEQLFVSQNTVKTQAISIYRKLGVSSRSDAVATAVEMGLLDG